MVALVGMAVVACGGTGHSGSKLSPSAHLMRVDELAAGELGSLPTGSQFARIAMFHHAPRQTTASKKHQSGIVYVQTGMQLLSYTGGQSVDIPAGTAVYLESVAHTHTNLGPTDSTWYFIALWPIAQRGLPLVNGSTVAFDTEDIPSSTLRPGVYIETLRRVTLQPGGHSPAHRFGGLEVVFVLDGTLTVDVVGHASVQLTAGQGTSVSPNTVTQELAVGSGKLDYLAYFVTPQGRPFETDVTSAPPG